MLKKVLELDEHQVVALVSMAMIQADKGDLAEALVIARQAYAIAPWYPDTIAVLAALMRHNDYEQSMHQLTARELYFTLAPSNFRLLTPIATNISEAASRSTERLCFTFTKNHLCDSGSVLRYLKIV